MSERRSSHLRRDVNDLVRSPDGKVSEAKLWANSYKAAVFYILLTHTEAVLKNEWVLAILVTVGIAPDLFKKVVSMRMGKNEPVKPAGN